MNGNGMDGKPMASHLVPLECTGFCFLKIQGMDLASTLEEEPAVGRGDILGSPDATVQLACIGPGDAVPLPHCISSGPSSKLLLVPGVCVWGRGGGSSPVNTEGSDWPGLVT